MRYNFSCILAGYLGDKEAALKMLQMTFSVAGESIIRVADADTDLDAIRDDPRFQAMLVQAKQRLGIKIEAEPTSAT
jgi:adenylate cyclase